MNSKDHLKSTKRLARITRKFCRAFIWIASIGTVIILAAAIIVSAVPVDHLNLNDSGSLTVGTPGLPLPLFEIKPYRDSNGNLNFSVDGGVFAPSETLSSAEALRGYMWTFCAKLATGAAVFVIIAFFLMGLLKSVENNEPFAVENVKRLRNIGITLIAGSIINPVIIALATLVATHSNLLDTKANSMVDFTLLLCGLLVIVLSGIFSYGARLQREHDQTV